MSANPISGPYTAPAKTYLAVFILPPEAQVPTPGVTILKTPSVEL